MSRRAQWRKVLDAEVKRWSARSAEDLALALQVLQVYEVAFEGKTYQVEVDLLENTERYVHVMVAVDDGSLPASLWPATELFVRDKAQSGT